MKWIINNKGRVYITFLSVILGVFFGLLTYSQLDRAEAVLGKPGNLTNINNKHNLSSTSSSSSVRASSETRICIFCHTPHHAITDSSLLNAPLWNHTLSSATYILNDSTPIDSTRGTYFVNQLTTPIQPDGASKLCLSCHDGTVAVGDLAIANITMASHSCLTNGKINVSCSSYIGTNLKAKHVVSIPMNDQLIANSSIDCQNITQISTSLRYPWEAGAGQNGDDVKLRPTTAQYDSQYGIDGGSVPSPPTATLYKAGYKYGVQCSTCHDPHYWDSTSTNRGWKFLAVPSNNLCGICHESGC